VVEWVVAQIESTNTNARSPNRTKAPAARLDARIFLRRWHWTRGHRRTSIIAGEVYPWCEQSIPHDKFAEISARISEREGMHFAEMTVDLKEHHARDKEALELALSDTV
jgi:hypothetical protein